jgi:site-specific recombinase XerD
MASVKILLRKDKKNKQGQNPIVIQVVHNRKKRIITLKHYINANEWDPQKELAIEKSPIKEHKIYLQKLNHIIEKRKNEIKQSIIELDEKGTPYTVDTIISSCRPILNNTTFFVFTEELIERMESLSKKGNARIYQQALNVFKTFRNEHDLSFEEFTYKVVIDFEEFLIKRGNKPNTVYTYMRKLKSAYNKAIKEGIVKEESYPFKNYQIKNEKTIKRAISKDDIIAIKNLDLSNNQTMLNARNIFLFSFYARGISFIDIANLQVKNITGDRLYYSRNKTNQKFSIRLTNQMLNIITQYNDMQDAESYLFPFIANNENDKYKHYLNALRLTNKKLKKIGEMAGLSIPLTTYVSRHSWATIAKRQGVPTAVISEGLGHETERTTQIYLDSFENDVLDAANDLITDI